MLVQCKQTKRELEMFWIEVPTVYQPEVEDILKRFTNNSDEDYEWKDAEDPWCLRCRVIATERHHIRILEKLIRKRYLCKYDNWNV